MKDSTVTNNVTSDTGGQIKARRGADLMREACVHEELRPGLWSRDVRGREIEGSIEHGTRRNAIYVLAGIIIAIIVGLIMFVL